MMNINLSEWDEDLESDAEEEYQSFLRTLKRCQGFGLLFVECSPAQGNQLIEKVRQDLSQKSVEVLQLTDPIENFYEMVENLPNREQVNIVFVQGLEQSFYEYEREKALTGWDSSKRYSYSWEGVPRVLMNLNQQRERLRDHFPVCFVFVLPLFGIKYFIQRAPDFFDWRSGFFEFPDQEQRANVLEPKDLSPTSDDVAYSEYFQKGVVLYDEHSYEAAIASYDQAIEIKPDFHEAWYNRGVALANLGRYEEAIADWDKAIEIKPDFHEAWYNRGVALANLGRYEEAIADWDKAIEIKPDFHEAWNNRGLALFNLGRYEAAIADYDQAIEIKLDKDEAWYNRGVALANLGRYEEAIADWDKAIEIKPDFHEAWYNKFYALRKLEIITLYNQAVEHQPNLYQAWFNKGAALYNLGHYEQAIISYDKAIEIKPAFHLAYYNKACCYALQGNIDLALENLQQAIHLNPEKCRQWAETKSDFDSIREDSRFQALMQGKQESKK